MREHEKAFALAAHLGILLWFVAYFGPLGLSIVLGIFALAMPIALLVRYGETSPHIAYHARQSLNLQLSFILYTAIGVALIFLTFGIGALLVIPLLIAMALAAGIFAIAMAISAYRGERPPYPCVIRFLR